MADRAKQSGLDKPAEYILSGKSPPLNIKNLLDKSNSNLDTMDKIMQGICHYLSHIISKSTEVLEELKKLYASFIYLIIFFFTFINAITIFYYLFQTKITLYCFKKHKNKIIFKR